jgi:hypothetical protein
MLFLTGVFDAVSVVLRISLVQMRTPDALRGRVAAVNALFISCSNQWGAVESGVTAQWFGTVPSVIVGGVATVVWSSRSASFPAACGHGSTAEPDQDRAAGPPATLRSVSQNDPVPSGGSKRTSTEPASPSA